MYTRRTHTHPIFSLLWEKLINCNHNKFVHTAILHNVCIQGLLHTRSVFSLKERDLMGVCRIFIIKIHMYMSSSLIALLLCCSGLFLPTASSSYICIPGAAAWGNVRRSCWIQKHFVLLDFMEEIIDYF